MKRTDIHRPSAIKPEEYVFVAFDYIKIGESGNILADCAYLQEQRSVKAAHMAQTGGKYSTHEHGGNCMVCGSVNAIYTATFYHALTNSYVRVGSDCTEKLDSSSGFSDSAFNAFRKAVHNALEYRAGKNKAAAILEAAGLSAAWELYSVTIPAIRQEMQKQFDADGIMRHGSIPYEELTIEDMVSKLVKYGSISDKATAFIGTLLTKITDRPALEANKVAERESAADCPTGRIEITGTVLGFKEQESGFGISVKALIQADSGFKVYGSAFSGIEKGSRVTFTATVTPSDTDSKFGFFKRPKIAQRAESINVLAEVC